MCFSAIIQIWALYLKHVAEKKKKEKKAFTSDSTGVQLAKQDKWFAGIRLKSSPDAA